MLLCHSTAKEHLMAMYRSAVQAEHKQSFAPKQMLPFSGSSDLPRSQHMSLLLSCCSSHCWNLLLIQSPIQPHNKPEVDSEWEAMLSVSQVKSESSWEALLWTKATLIWFAWLTSQGPEVYFPAYPAVTQGPALCTDHISYDAVRTFSLTMWNTTFWLEMPRETFPGP